MWTALVVVLKRGVTGTVLGIWVYSAAGSAQVSSRVDFRRDIQPLLKQYCIECHGPSQQLHGFRLDRRQDAMRGGTIAVIVPGNSAGSRLYLKLIGNQYGPQMPPTGPLSPEQISRIKAWIDQGAEWPDELAGASPTQSPHPKAAPLLQALRAGDHTTLKGLIRADPQAVNLRGFGGTTPLMQAVLYGTQETVRFLLEQGADPNLRNEAGATALMWAVDDLDKTRLLLQHRAEVNASSGDGRTPLLIAAGRFGNKAVVKLLLEHGADLTAKSPATNGYATVLSEAARTGDEALLWLLIERGAEVKQTGVLALANAARAQCAKCLEILLERTDRRTQTMAAAVLLPPAGDARAVKLLLERGVDANTREPKGNTLLMLAASSEALPVETIEALIKRGADLNAQNPQGRTALDWAKLRGPSPVVDLLVKAGAKEGAAPTSPVLSYRPAPSARAALARSLPPLQKADSIFLQKAGCVSCHHNSMTAMSVATARQSGLAVNEQLVRANIKGVAAYLEIWRERALQGVGIPGESGPISDLLLGLAAENYPSNVGTDAMVRFVMSQQWPDGHWTTFAHRPPLGASDFKVTATSLRALQLYGVKAQRAAYDQAVQRAADWLRQAQPQVNQDRAFQLLGLAWAGRKTDSEIIRKTARDLLKKQRVDGGWSQLPALASDAYATGQALVALKQAGALRVSDPAFQRGLKYLLNTQLEDGSWYVRSRAVPLQPAFDGGFPHGTDQWISAAGSNWAALALALALTPQ
jgi:ankyrin repeat protein